MDKYDTIIKIEEIRKLINDEQYIKAEKILDTMDINKIKSLTDLSIIADIYIQNERYDEAYRVLTRMFLKTKSRRILYQLIEVSIKRGDLEDAEDYLNQYIKTVPNDYNKFIFRYRIDKQKKMPYEVLIYSLEQLKEYEYIEKWAYELAKIYHKAGMKDKCIRECSDIILWFGDGLFVEKAKLLKGYYVGEINPTGTQKLKNIKEEYKLELEKTKDYSAIREEIDKFLAEDEKKEVSIGNTVPNETHEKTSKQDNIIERNKILEQDNIIERNKILEQDNTLEQDKILKELKTLVHDNESDNKFTEHSLVLNEAIVHKEQNHEVQNHEERSHDNPNSEKWNYDVKNYEGQNHEGQFYEDQYGENQDYIEQNDKPDLLSCYFEDSEINYKKVLGYFYHKQICKDSIMIAIKHILNNENKSNYLIISGEKGSGKSKLARNITKILYDLGRIESSKIAKINGDNLNNISLEQHIDRLKNSTLLIEEAGLLNENGVNQLNGLINELNGHLFVILEDQPEWIEELLNNYVELKAIFVDNIKLPKYTAKDLFHFANYYIEEQDYQLSTEAETILLNKSQEISELSDIRNHLNKIFEIVKKAKLLADERYKKELRKVIGSRNIIKTDFLYITADDLLV